MDEGLAAMYVALAKANGTVQGNYDYGAGGTQAANGHYTDIGKLPWHPTFSDESKYSTDSFKGGTWGNDSLATYSYTPSLDQIKAGYTNGLYEYMKRVEPNTRLVIPEGATMQELSRGR